MARFTVLEGGVCAGERRPVVWNRAPLTGAARAFILRDSDDPSEPIEAAYDDGRTFLIGIRRFRLPVDQPALSAWLAGAAADGLQIIDERATEIVQLADGPADQRLIPGVRPAAYDFRAFQRRREARRGAAPLPAGGLFDQVSRDQQDLF